MSGKTKERKKGALWDKKPEESGGKGLMDMLRGKKKKKNTGTIRQMKKQDLGYREEKMAERRRRKQSNL